MEELTEQESRHPKHDELEKLAAPIVDYLYRYGSPHHAVVITQTSAELLRGEVGVFFEPRD